MFQEPLRPVIETKPVEAITSFNGNYSFLSNFHPVDILFEGIWYPSVEHAYVGAKFSTKADKIKAKETVLPRDVKALGRLAVLPSDWATKRLTVMEHLLKLKFSYVTFFEKLNATGDATLIEGNDWGDSFWGVDATKRIGSNHLGKLLMKVRKELRKQVGRDLLAYKSKLS